VPLAGKAKEKRVLNHDTCADMAHSILDAIVRLGTGWSRDPFDIEDRAKYE
jgi:hypothetical protein